MLTQVEISRFAERQLENVPKHIFRKFYEWVSSVERLGIEEIRKIPGFHDEPLKGRRHGQRSIRLSRSYRAIYVMKGLEVKFVCVEEVNKHDY